MLLPSFRYSQLPEVSFKGTTGREQELTAPEVNIIANLSYEQAQIVCKGASFACVQAILASKCKFKSKSCIVTNFCLRPMILQSYFILIFSCDIAR